MPSRLNINARAIGKASKGHEPPQQFVLTCTACDAVAHVSGRGKALKWEKEHKQTHGRYAKMVFVRHEILKG